MILADPTEVNQVLINLCTNAVHAMGETPGVFEVALEAITLDYRSAAKYEGLMPGKFIKLTVKDTGEGISSYVMGRIFDPYFTTKDVNQGLGMGLAVVYGIVKKSNGAIKIESAVGKGTEVEVLFPQLGTQPATQLHEYETLPKGSEHILIVDDEEALVELMKQMLERLGYKVVGKTSSLDAMNAFIAEPQLFDLVVTDMAMPQMSGDNFARELIKIRSDVRIVLCTGHSDRIDEHGARATYFPKSINGLMEK